jgi:hypothetical protein
MFRQNNAINREPKYWCVELAQKGKKLVSDDCIVLLKHVGAIVKNTEL